MSTKPSVGYDSFQRDKLWAKVALLNDADILNSDFNEAQDICRYRDFLTVANSVGLNTRVAEGFRIDEATSNTNNFNVIGGTAISYGSIVFTEGDTTLDSGERAFAYESVAPNYYNYLFLGKVSATEALTKLIIDDDKDFVLDHNLSACRVLMLSGAEIGNSFTIQGSYGAGWGGNSFILDSLGTFGIVAGDSYVILPPALTTPSFPDGFTARVDTVYLQTWYEEINDNEDSNIVPPTALAAQSYRDQLRWCVRVAEGHYDAINNVMVSGSIPTASDSDNPFGVHYIPLAELSRANDEARIFTSYITNYRGVELPLNSLSQEMVDLRTSPWLGEYDSAPDRVDGLENAVKNSKLFNGSFELGAGINSDIPGWIPSSTSWGITTGASHQSKCVAVDHTSRATTRGETLTSYPFYVRPSQTLRFYALSKGVSAGATIQAKLKVFGEGYDWYSDPLTTKTLSFGVGTVDWLPMETTFVAPSTAQWGYVQLTTDSQTGTVYFDDVRVEYLEEAMNNTGVQIPSVELMACSFNEGIRGWNVNQQYAQNENVTTLTDTVPCIKLTNGGTNTSTRIYSWPISTSTCNFFDDTILVSVKAKYSDVVYGILTGPQVGITFYDAAFNEVTTSNTSVSLAVLDWDTSISSGKNPASTSYNTYNIQFTAPKNASFFTISLGLLASSGSVTFNSLNVRRFGNSVNVLNNRTWHDICANGEFGRGFVDPSIVDEERNDPPLGTYDVIGWDIADDTTTQYVHWVKNSPEISAPSGDRAIEFNIPTGDTTSNLLLTQIVNRTITKQDFTHGFVLDFDYMYSNPAVKTELWIDFLDSNKESVVAKTVIDLIDTDNLVTLGWTNKVIGIAPPSTTTLYGSNTSNSPVYLSISFRVSQTAASASDSLFRVAGVRLWSRTIQTSTNLISDEQFVAMDGYYVHDTPGYTKETSFYKNEQKIIPGSDNKFLLENDGDLMRYTRPHADRHYPVLDEDISTVEDAIPYATSLQTGLLKKEDWTKFDQALQRLDMEGILQPGIKEGLYVDEYAAVFPGVALDINGRRLEVTTKTQLTIPTYDDPQTTNIIYIWWNEALVGDNKTELKIISSSDTESPNLYVIPPMDDLLPSTAIILALGKFDKDQYELEYNTLSETDKLLYQKHFEGVGYSEVAVPPSVTPTYDSYSLWRAPSEYLINAEFTGITETLREVDLFPGAGETVIPTPWEPTYKIIDTRISAYRILRMRDDDLIMFYTIAPNAYSPISTANYNSNNFDEFGSGSDIGWGDGEPLTGAFEHWSDFLDLFGSAFNLQHYKEGADAGKHRSISIPYISGTGGSFEEIFRKDLYTDRSPYFSIQTSNGDPFTALTTINLKKSGSFFIADYLDESSNGKGHGLWLDTNGLHVYRAETTAGVPEIFTYQTISRIIPPTCAQMGALYGEGGTDPAHVYSIGDESNPPNWNILNGTTIQYYLDLPVGCILTDYTLVCKCAGGATLSTSIVSTSLSSGFGKTTVASTNTSTTSASWTALAKTAMSVTCADSVQYLLEATVADGGQAYVGGLKISYEQYNYLV